MAFAQGRLSWPLVLLLVLNAFEGVGILMLVPLLAGVFDTTESVGGVGEQVVRIFEVLGLPLTLPVVLALFMGLVCAREGLMRFQVKAFDALDQGFVLSLREQLYRAITHVQWLFFTRTQSSDFLQVLTADINRIGNGTQHVGCNFRGVNVSDWHWLGHYWQNPNY